jgi:hypothetical protein
MFQKVTKKALVVVMFLSLVLGILVIPSFGGIEAQAATVKLNKTKATIYAGDTVQLTLKNAKSVTWKTSNKKVATVTAKGKVKGIKAGSAKITATNKKTKKSYTCKLTVKAVKSFGLSKSDISLFSTGGKVVMYKGAEIKGATYVLDGKTLTSAEVWVEDGYTYVDLFGTSGGQLSEGDHTFSIKKTGYKTITVTLTYEAIKVEGVFARDPWVSNGTLYIYGNPDLLGKTLTIKVDGTTVTPIGTPALTSDEVLLIKVDVSGLSAGSHSVTVTADGFPEETATFYISK